jgi:hypothetical protein
LSRAIAFSQATLLLEMVLFMALSCFVSGFFLLRFLGITVSAWIFCKPRYPVSTSAFVLG